MRSRGRGGGTFTTTTVDTATPTTPTTTTAAIEKIHSLLHVIAAKPTENHWQDTLLSLVLLQTLLRRNLPTPSLPPLPVTVLVLLLLLLLQSQLQIRIFHSLRGLQ